MSSQDRLQQHQALNGTTKRSGIGDPKSTGLGATNLLTVSLDQADSTISSESKVRPDPKTTSASHSRQTSASDAFAHGHTDREPPHSNHRLVAPPSETRRRSNTRTPLPLLAARMGRQPMGKTSAPPASSSTLSPLSTRRRKTSSRSTPASTAPSTSTRTSRTTTPRASCRSSARSVLTTTRPRSLRRSSPPSR